MISFAWLSSRLLESLAEEELRCLVEDLHYGSAAEELLARESARRSAPHGRR